jgi:DHA2 family multidrug resistance protein
MTPENRMQAEKGARYKWVLTWSVLIGAMLAPLNAMIVSVAVPDIMASFGVNVDQVQWVMTVYMLAAAVVIPCIGWLGETFGYKHFYLAGVLIFTLGAGLSGLAWNIESLIAFRVIQALGGGVLWPLGLAIIIEVFPEEQRGMGMGVFSLGGMLGPSLEPALGGYLVDHFNWPSVFLINLPLGALAFILVAVVMRDEHPRSRTAFDYPGFAAMCIFVVSLLLALSQGQKEGWTSSFILSLFAIFAAGLALFLIIELRTEKPLLDLRLLKFRNFSAAFAANVLFGVSYYPALFLLPLVVVNVLLYTPFQTGLLMVPGSLVMAAAMLLAGWLADRYDARLIISAGIITGFMGMIWQSHLNLQTSSMAIVLMLILRGGMGIIYPPLMKEAVRDMPKEKVAMASGMLYLMMYIGGMFGISLFSTFLEARTAVHNASYSEWVTLSSGAVQQSMSMLKGFFMSVGNVGHQAEALSLAMLRALISREAVISAFDDAFFILAFTYLFLFVPTFLLRRGAALRAGG